MTTAEEIRDVVFNYLEDSNPGFSSLDASAKETAELEDLIDSFEMYNLTSFIEQRFNIRIQDNEVIPGNFGTPSAIVQLIQRKTSR